MDFSLFDVSVIQQSTLSLYLFNNDQHATWAILGPY